MDLRSLMFKVGFDGSASAVKEMDSATTKLSKKTEGATINLERMGDSFNKVGKGLMKKVTAPIVGLGAASIRTVSSFDDSMSKVRAISGATSNEFEKMRELAKDLGATTAHSASAAADGMTILAASGMEVNDILETTPDLLSLASAAGLDLESSASILTGTLAQFNLSAKEGTMVTDVFAKAASSANTNVGELGEAMTYAGGDAANMGMDIQQTNAILGIFANANLRGGRAGTTFSAMFKDLTSKAKNGAIQIGKSSVAVYDAAGNIRDMGSILSDVESATKGMTDAQRDAALQAIFQGQSMRGVNAFLSQGAEKYKELESAIYDSDGAAQKMAEDMEDNIGGAFRGMGSAIEGFLIDVGDVYKDDVKGWAEGIGNLASKFGQLDEGTQRIIVGAAGIAAATGPVIWGAGKVVSTINKIPSAIENTKAALGILKSAANPTTLVIMGLVAAGIMVYKNWDTIKEKATETWDSITNKVEGSANKIKGFWSGLKDFMKNPIKGTVDIGKNLWDRITGKNKVDGSHRTGLARVPWDGYVAEVHKDEAILPKSEAEEYRRGTYKTRNNVVYNPSININVGQNVDTQTQRDLERTIKDIMAREREKFFAKLNLKTT